MYSFLFIKDFYLFLRHIYFIVTITILLFIIIIMFTTITSQPHMSYYQDCSIWREYEYVSTYHNIADLSTSRFYINTDKRVRSQNLRSYILTYIVSMYLHVKYQTRCLFCFHRCNVIL